MKRRELLIHTAAAALLTHSRLSGQNLNSSSLSRLACNSWPFRGYFNTPAMAQYRDKQYPLLTQADFPQFLADHFGIHHVELLPQHFVDTTPPTIDAINAGLTKAKARCCNLMGVELAGGVFRHDANPQQLAKEADRWIGVARSLRCPSITIALTGEGAADVHTAAHNLSALVEEAHRHGIKVLFHNDDLQRESAEILTSIVDELGRSKTGTCPDFGNFATRSASFALSQLGALAPYSSTICHAKDGIADKGRFYPDNFVQSMRTMHEAGFQGLYSLEYEGLEPPLTGTRLLVDLVQANLPRA